MTRQQSTLSHVVSSFCSDGMYCPAENNIGQISSPASLFLHHKYGYYIKLRFPFRHDIQKKLFHYLQLGDVFSYSGGYIKVISRNSLEIYDLLHKEPIGSVCYASKLEKI